MSRHHEKMNSPGMYKLDGVKSQQPDDEELRHKRNETIQQVHHHRGVTGELLKTKESLIQIKPISDFIQQL